MPRPLPTAIAAALARAKAQHAEDGAPTIPFVPDTRLDPRQAEAFGAPPASLLDWKTWEAQLLGHAGAALPYLGFGHDELRDEAQRIPRQLHEEVFVPDAEPADYAACMVAAAERRFGEPVPGQTRDAQLARVLDAGYWRRFLVRRVREAREHLSLKLGLVGAGARQYCSDAAREQRRTQLQNQEKWLNETMLRAVIDGETVEIPMVQVVKGAHQKLSRLYAFIAAMDRLAVDADLTVALLTTTLEGEWHASPEFKSKSHRWNGATPAEANRELGQRFQSIRRDLDKQGICLSGLWAGEPHQDGCPHRHHWLLYDPQHERAVFAAFLRYFPGKLKLRRDERAGGDAIIETREDALRGLRRPLTHAKEGAQVDVSIIDREKGSGASYVLKYVMKAVLSEATYVDLVKSVGAEGVNTSKSKSTSNAPTLTAKEARKQLRTLQSIDAHRSTWRMRSFQFFGIRDCLSLWDELRRIKAPPLEPRLRELWRLARGGEACGTVRAEQQRGDAYGFLKALGGLAAAQPEQLELGADAPQRARIYTEPTETRYGETGARIAGVELVQPAERAAPGEEAPAPVVLERVATRTVRWEMVPKDSTPVETTEGKVGAAASGKAKTAKASHRP
jgi:hypothetical protein